MLIAALAVAASTFSPFSTASAADVCTASGGSLGAAKAAYAAACTVPRVDCDPIGGAWTCSSARIGVRAPGGITGPASPAPVATAPTASRPQATVVPTPPASAVVRLPTPAPVVPVVAPTLAGGACQASGPNLGAAKAAYASRCAAPRVDCDAMNGGWTCASSRIGPGAPASASPVSTAPSSRPIPAAAPPAPSAVAPKPAAAPAASASLVAQAESATLNGFWRRTATSIVYTGPNRFAESSRRDDANLAYRLTVPSAGRYRFVMRSRATSGGAEPPNDVWFRVGSLPWTKAFTPKPASAFSTTTIGERGGRRATDLLDTDLPAGPTTVTISGRSSGHEIDRIELVRVGNTTAPVTSAATRTPASTPAIAPPAVSGGSGNGTYRRGDLIALHHDNFPDPDDFQAMVANRLVLDSTGADFLMVSGTIGHARDRTLGPADALSARLFPGRLNAKPRNLWRTGNYDRSAVLSAASAWSQVLSGGRTVHVAEGGAGDFTALVLGELQRQGVGGLKRVRVVQHSAANERNTRADRLAFTRRVATYVSIGDGNVPNATPDFNRRDASVEARARNASLYAAEWRTALDAIETARRMDFSDTVELLYILGIPTSAARDVRAFADRYIR